MSAARTLGACQLVGLGRVRYRNRNGAAKGLGRARQACARNGMPEALWPVETFRCLPREQGGCNGHHLRSDRRAVDQYLAEMAPVIKLDRHAIRTTIAASEAA